MNMTLNIHSMSICAFFCLLVVAQQRPMPNSGSTGKDQLETAVVQGVQSDLALERLEIKKRRKKIGGEEEVLYKTPPRPYRHLRHQDSLRSSRTCDFQNDGIFIKTYSSSPVIVFYQGFSIVEQFAVAFAHLQEKNMRKSQLITMEKYKR